MASGEGQSHPSTSRDAVKDHKEDYDEYGPPLPTQEELREMERRKLVGEATNMMLNFAKDLKLAKYMTETAFQDVHAQWKARTTSSPKPDSKKQYSEKELEQELKRELSLLTTAIAAFGSIYCGILFSIEASVSYALGALGSLLYLQLLFRHADGLSETNVASVFRRKRQKKIGVRSSDLQDAFEKAFFGSSFALSSPRLVIPVALYGLWTLEHQLGHLQLDLQITPLMFGFFAYKAAVLVQTFWENKNLAMSFEKDKSTSLGR
ncbi:hypothetical protein L7F22_002870 [Adiantum nelumboides]|nr:hypothetical protein [Adiantum nelumboides]